MKRHLAILLSLTLILSFIPFSAFADEEEGAFQYRIEEDTVLITKYLGEDAEVTVPAQIGGKPVTAIGDGAFIYNRTITSVTLPEGILLIDSNAFDSCPRLIRVELPESLKEIGDYALAQCPKLTGLTLPAGLTRIGAWAFFGCNSLTTVTVPGGVEQIGDSAFSYCHGLTSVRLESGVTRVGQCAFSNCDSLTALRLPSSLTLLGERAFQGCTALESVTLPRKVTATSYELFSGCTSLKEVKVSADFYLFGKSTFEGCTSLTKVPTSSKLYSIGDSAFGGCAIEEFKIPSTLAVIGAGAFAGCKLTEVTIPDTVTSIGARAFSTDVLIRCNRDSAAHKYAKANKTPYVLLDAPGLAEEEFFSAIDANYDYNSGSKIIYQYTGYLKEVVVPDTYKGKPVTGLFNRAFAGTGVVKVTVPPGVTDYGYEVFADCGDLVNITIPEGVTDLGKNMFWNCVSLTDVSLPSTLKNLEGGAFRKCSSLTGISLPAGLTRIGGGAFEGCVGLTSVHLPDTVTFIGSSAFQGCSGLTEITIPRGVEELGPYTLSDCTALQNIYAAANSNYLRDIDGVLYSKDGSTLLRVPCGRSGELVIPEGVKSIADYAAFDCENLTLVTLPESVIHIGDHAFHQNTRITGSFEVDEAGVMYNGDALISADPEKLTGAYAIRPGTKTIAQNAFANCTGLTAVVIPDSVNRIGSLAFQSCTALADITLPEGVRLGMGAFDDTAFFNDPANYDESGVLYLNSYLLWAKADTLAGSYTVKEGTKVIAAGSIFDCSKLIELVIPEGVTFIDYHACILCRNLEYVTLPQSITLIDPSVFTDCDKLQTIYYASTREDWAAVGFDVGSVPVNFMAASPDPVIIGDADGDGNVSSTDARLALQISVDKIKAHSVANPGAPDVDGDGKITSTDARLILQYSVGKIKEWP